MEALMSSMSLHRPIQMFWCSDCQRYCAAHPLDHLVDEHPPQHPDGSTVLPERIEVAA